MDFFTFSNDLMMLSVAAVAIFSILQSMEKYPEPPTGTKFLYYGFFVLFINQIFFSEIDKQNPFLVIVSLSLHFVSIASIVTGGIKFKLKYYSPLPLFYLISAIGVGVSVLVVLFQDNQKLYTILYDYSLIAGLVFLAICFLLRPKMEKTGGYYITSFSLFAMAAYFFLQLSPTGKQVLSIAPFSIIILSLFIIGLVMVNANVIWHQLEFLLHDVKQSKERLRLVIQSSPFPIVISKLRDDTLMLVNEKAAETFGIASDMPHNYKTTDFFANAENRKQLLSILEKNSEVENYEVALKKSNSTDTFWMLSSCRVIDFEGDIALYAAFQDISEIKEKEKQLFTQATRDPLTNCYNRRQFEELANKEIYKASRNSMVFTVAMIDADHFKNVNDTYGHATGDIVLKELAECCRKTLRESDIVARYGGEEFVILLPETSVEHAYTVCDRLREKIAEIEVSGVNGETVSFTVSMGLAESSVAADINSILTVADEALYIAKQTGRNRVVIGEKGMNTHEEPVSEVSSGLVSQNISEIEDDGVPLVDEDFTTNNSIWGDDYGDNTSGLGMGSSYIEPLDDEDDLLDDLDDDVKK